MVETPNSDKNAGDPPTAAEQEPVEAAAEPVAEPVTEPPPAEGEQQAPA